MSFYKNKQNHKIAYKSLKGRGLGIIFIHGLNSDMNGAKALTVERYEVSKYHDIHSESTD